MQGKGRIFRQVWFWTGAPCRQASTLNRPITCFNEPFLEVSFNLELTLEQVETAKACGCEVVSATHDQIWRLAQQRRIFRWNGQDVILRRADGSLETFGTLMQLLKQHAQAMELAAATATDDFEADAPAELRQEPVQRDMSAGPQSVRSRQHEREPFVPAAPPVAEPAQASAFQQPRSEIEPNSPEQDKAEQAPAIPASHRAEEQLERLEAGQAQDIAAGPPAPRPEPAVPIAESIQPDYLVCLEDGRQLKMLKRHLKTAYNLTPEQYRERWNLPPDYPMVAPNYAEQRSSIAKQVVRRSASTRTSKRVPAEAEG